MTGKQTILYNFASRFCFESMEVLEEFLGDNDDFSEFVWANMEAYVRRIFAVSDQKSRIAMMQSMTEFARQQLHEFQTTHNAFLRNSRRRLRFLITSGECDINNSANPRQNIRVRTLDAIRTCVVKLTDFIKEPLRYVFMAMSGEQIDDVAFTNAMKNLSDVRRECDRTRSKYMQAYGTLNFAFVLMDSHFFAAIAIKIARYALLFIVARIAKTWYEIRSAQDSRNVTAKTKKNKDFLPFLNRLLPLLVLTDLCVVGIVFGVTFWTRQNGRQNVNPFSILWWSLLKDFLFSNVVTMVIALSLVQIFRKKMYLRIQSDELVSFQAFFDIVDRILLVNSIIPYFMLI